MRFEEFKEAAKKQDSNNVFESGSLIENIPEILELFYSELNPIDVEVNIEGAIIRFVSISEYNIVQEEYTIDGDVYIFATCDGDPIFLFNDAVYTIAHGIRNADKEKVADTFEEYLKKIQ